MKPARFETLRCAVARWLFLGPTRHATRYLALLVAPPCHPWRLTYGSAVKEFSRVTEKSLRPRGPQPGARSILRPVKVAAVLVTATSIPAFVADACIAGDGIGPNVSFLSGLLSALELVANVL